MRSAKFRVHGRFDSAGASQVATITVDRDTNMFKVRPLRRRRSYDLDLATVAAIIVQRIVWYEAMEKRKAKKSRRRSRVV